LICFFRNPLPALNRPLVFFGLLITILSSCNSGKKDGSDSIWSDRDYSELHLDSVSIQTFLSSDTHYRAVSQNVQQFYQDRSYQYAWISEGKLNPAGPNFYNQLENYMHDFADSSLYDPRLDSVLKEVVDYDGSPNLKTLTELEFRLTLAWFRYTESEFRGKVNNPKSLDWFIPRKKKNYEALLQAHFQTGTLFGLEEPANPYYQRLKEKVRAYVSLDRSGNWPLVDSQLIRAKQGQVDSSVMAVKKILRLTNVWTESDSSAVYTKSFGMALAQFQHRMGLPETGKPDNATVREMEVPLKTRIRQMMVNLERLRWLPDTLAGNFLVVNIPEYKLHVFENGQPAWESNVVVGKMAGRTQIFKGNLSQIILNPSWGVPPGIANKEVLPGLKKDRHYLDRHQMQAFKGNTLVDTRGINWHRYSKRMPFNIRQKAGPDNPLGRFKFYLSNSYWIYLHDSNEKYLYDAHRRDFSHGCIRVEKADELARYLLRNDSIWPNERLGEMMESKTDYGITVKPAVPVYILYLTSWVGRNGELHFRKDVYQRDDILAKSVFGE
jgi:L,D-transpeptidase YcbB